MEQNGLIKPGVHYHVRWSSHPFLDWKYLPTKEEANQLAERIKKPNERYDIVERDDECERCKAFQVKAFSRSTSDGATLSLIKTAKAGIPFIDTETQRAS